MIMGIMMKYLLTILIVFTFITLGCKKSSTNSDGEINRVNTHVTVNVKTATEYFNFSTNSGSAETGTEHDIVFYSVMWTPPGAPVSINDPRFRVDDGLSIAVVNAENLDDVTEVPASEKFIENFVSEMGEWYYETSAHFILPSDNVYIVNTADGKFPAFEIIKYIDEEGNSGVFNIEWKYLNN